MSAGKMQLVKNARLGLYFYECLFGNRYHDSDQEDVPDEDWLLLRDECYEQNFALPVSGKRVALVGNGVVRGRGRHIDEHDVVIRVNFPYSWAQDPKEDGRRFTHWVGLAKNEVLFPDNFLNPAPDMKLSDLSDRFSSLEGLHCISHHHLQVGFWRRAKQLGLVERTYIHWAAPVVFEFLERNSLGRVNGLLSAVTARNYHENGWGGWYTWDTLLTGVRAAICALSGNPATLHLYGLNFYAESQRRPWDLHNLALNRAILDHAMVDARARGIEVALIDNVS
ncbi:glycosyltransferase family 29 protein [Methylobacterium sp. J-030]|uniref:glycosyltransferase family 29 protein n=1 Tax=Methylobacterium sp. J-030 TaxID=2836627 RepID=UPI001FB9F528|nr:glycosyltransferase family 29 protein [Methylobacterium sp. J-030]MCJ2071980.1 glycosyltransferase family 29 protein [Methylobacterium sp. J-030]